MKQREKSEAAFGKKKLFAAVWMMEYQILYGVFLKAAKKHGDTGKRGRSISDRTDFFL